ncbi:MAG: hypothetical protein COA97_04805 [Flavobacteriales bacterium]|nr:MAG: hypothetical protein COA97_04805 [Flavobacteriales bacterium]
MQIIVKKILFIILICFFFLPLLQFTFSLIEKKPLSGYFEDAEKPKYNNYKWISGEFQDLYLKYFRDNVGFRSFFIKNYSQLRFSLFNVVNKNVGLMGSNNVIFEPRYVKPIGGADFVGKKTILKKVQDLDIIKNSLEDEGKRILVVLCPNKTRYFYDELPNHLKKIGLSNYEVYIEYFEKYKIDYIDFNQYFMQKKKDVPFNLIPKYGIHWSEYGSVLAADSIVKYCNQNYNYQLPHYIFDSIEVTNIAKGSDYDMGESLNLWKKLGNETYVYPYTRLSKGNNSKKKNILVISDSFFYSMYKSNFSTDIFNMSGFWYYNRDLKGKNARTRKDSDIEQTIGETDLVIIMLTEWNLYRFGFGIVEELKRYYTGGEIENKWVRYYIDRIRSDRKWYDQVKKEALIRRITIDSMLLISAEHMSKKKEAELKNK